MSETSKFCVPDKGSCRLLMRLTPSLGENQNSRLDRRGLLFPMVPARMIVVSRVPTVSSPPMDCVPRSSDSDVERSEEHTSELQSRFDLVCRLLLEKKN